MSGVRADLAPMMQNRVVAWQGDPEARCRRVSPMVPSAVVVGDQGGVPPRQNYRDSWPRGPFHRRSGWTPGRFPAGREGVDGGAGILVGAIWPVESPGHRRVSRDRCGEDAGDIGDSGGRGGGDDAVSARIGGNSQFVGSDVLRVERGAGPYGSSLVIGRAGIVRRVLRGALRGGGMGPGDAAVVGQGGQTRVGVNQIPGFSGQGVAGVVSDEVDRVLSVPFQRRRIDVFSPKDVKRLANANRPICGSE